MNTYAITTVNGDFLSPEIHTDFISAPETISLRHIAMHSLDVEVAHAEMAFCGVMHYNDNNHCCVYYSRDNNSDIYRIYIRKVTEIGPNSALDEIPYNAEITDFDDYKQSSYLDLLWDCMEKCETKIDTIRDGYLSVIDKYTIRGAIETETRHMFTHYDAYGEYQKRIA